MRAQNARIERTDPQSELGGGLGPASTPPGTRPSPPRGSAQERHPSFRSALDALQQANQPEGNRDPRRGIDSQGATVRGAKLARDLLDARDTTGAANEEDGAGEPFEPLDELDSSGQPDYGAPF